MASSFPTAPRKPYRRRSKRRRRHIEADQRYATARRLPHHRFVMLLTVVALLFVVQTGLVPFDFIKGWASGRKAELFGFATDRLTFPDIVSNIFLYLPVGILLHATWRRRMGQVTAWFGAVVTALLMSGMIEWIQAYAESRVSSIIDVAANALGTAIGATIAVFGVWILPRLLGAILYELQEQPEMARIKAYGLALLVLAAVPFSFSFDAGRFKQAVKSAHVVPFSSLETLHREAEAAAESNDRHGHEMARWAMMKCGSRWIAEAASFALLVWLLHAALSRGYGFSDRAAFGLIWWVAGGLAIGLSLLQLPIISRGFDGTDILFRWLGISAGLVTRSMFLRNASEGAAQQATRFRRQLAVVGCMAAACYILYTGVIPLAFGTDTSPTTSLASQEFLPFYAYFAGRFDIAMDDILEKALAYALFGALLSLVVKGVARQTIGRQVALTGLVGVVFAAAIEFVQMFMPIRTASTTDLILAGVGCAVGVLAKNEIMVFMAFAAEQTMVGAPAIATPQSPMTPSDQLIGTLTDPHPEAPTEPSQHREPAEPSHPREPNRK